MDLPEKLAALAGRGPEPVLTAAEQYAEYVKARRAYEQGKGTWGDVEAWINDDVARLITQAEDQDRARLRAEFTRAAAMLEAQADARRMLRSMRRKEIAMAPVEALGKVNWAVVAIVLYVLVWVILLLYMAASIPSPAPVAPTWQTPMQWENTGPGTLVTQVGGVLQRHHVSDMLELTSGADTQLPAYSFGDDGQESTVDGWFWFQSDGSVR